MRLPFHPDLHHPAAELPAGEQAELLPGHAEVESVLGVSLVGVENMEKSVRQILNNDTSAISTLRCLKLYLERLGCDFGDGQQLQRAAGGLGGWSGCCICGDCPLGWHTITSWGAKGTPRCFVVAQTCTNAWPAVCAAAAWPQAGARGPHGGGQAISHWTGSCTGTLHLPDGLTTLPACRQLFCPLVSEPG